jgi:hypothetical protein
MRRRRPAPAPAKSSGAATHAEAFPDCKSSSADYRRGRICCLVEEARREQAPDKLAAMRGQSWPAVA